MAFQDFLRPIECKPSTVDKIVSAACCLHNWLRPVQCVTPSHSQDLEDINTGEIIPGIWREQCKPLLPIHKCRSNNCRQDAEKVRQRSIL